MNCTICCQPTLLGAKLCTACRSALKRARDESVLELPKRPETAARERRRTPRQPPPTAGAATVVGTPVRLLRGWTGYAALAALAGTVLTVGYLTNRSSDPTETPAVAAAAPPRTAPLPVLAAAAVTPQATSRPESSAPAQQETARVETSPTPSVPTANEVLAKAPVARPNPATIAAKESPVAPARSAPSVNSEAMTAFGYDPEPPRAKRVAAASPVVVSAQTSPEPDRWASLADALGRCGREPFFSRPSCEERARARPCSGFWGQAALCPNPIQHEHTR